MKKLLSGLSNEGKSVSCLINIVLRGMYESYVRALHVIFTTTAEISSSDPHPANDHFHSFKQFVNTNVNFTHVGVNMYKNIVPCSMNT